MRKISITILCLIIFIGCASSSSKKTIDNKDVPTTLFGLLQKPDDGEQIKETPSEEVPSFEQNRVYKDIEGFPDYIIGVGDIITISMLKASGQESVDIKVPPSGKISYSFLDNVRVVGRTASEIATEISKLLEVYVKRPRITIVVREYNSKKVFLLGEISRIEGLPQSGPGVYPLKGKITLLKKLVAVGGYTTRADLNRVELTRGGKVYHINLNKMLTQAGESHDIILENEDRIIIPQQHAYIEEQLVKSRVYVLGEVKFPSLIESKTDITVLEALSRAQGLTNMAKLNHARIVRGDINNPQVIPLDLDMLINKSDMKLNVVLQDGDVIFIPTTTLGKFSHAFSQILPVLNALTYPAIYRDLYTTGGVGILNTGARPTGVEGVSSTPVITIQNK